MQLCRNEFTNQEKKLKNNRQELETYNKIINHIKICKNFEDLKQNPISKTYGFEQLKYEFGNYYSFNLSKKGGVIRLIVSEGENHEELNLVFISMDHYKDFRRKF